MQITSAFAAPRKVEIAGHTLWVPPLCINDLALIVEWLDCEVPGRGDREFPPSLSENWNRAISGDGVVTVAYSVLRHQGFTWAQAARLIIDASPEERVLLFDAAFTRRRGRRLQSDGEDIAQLFWGPVVQAVCEKYQMSPLAVGQLTLDQFDLLTQDGCNDERPKGTGALTIEEVMDIWADSRARWAKAQEAGDNDATA